MSDKSSSKSLLKPKVRFSQKSSESTEESAVRPFHGPTIRDIVTLKKPVIIVHSKNSNEDDKTTKTGEKITDRVSTNITENVLNLSHDPVNVIDQLQQKTQQLKISSDKPSIDLKIPKTTESASSKLSSGKSSKSGRKSSVTFADEKTEVVANVLQNHGQFSKQTEKKINVVKSHPITTVPLILINGKSKNPVQSEKHSSICQNRVGQFENKENLVRKLSSNKPLKMAHTKLENVTKIVKATPKTSTVSSKLAQSKSPKKSVFASRRPASISCREPKIPVAGTMACLKSRRKHDKSPVKKSVIRNKAGPLPKVYVGPGVLKTEPLSSDVIDVYKKPDVASSNKLIKPEFNSIVGTMRRLEEMKKKKIVTDIESLPATYKNLMMGKISGALDFPASESVFRDLVDISINENQLPMKMTRSKDPEPRQKDLVPNLSDFFTPQYCEEYTEASQIRPRTPEVFDNWSAFTISDRINSWKNRLDDN